MRSCFSINIVLGGAPPRLKMMYEILLVDIDVVGRDVFNILQLDNLEYGVAMKTMPFTELRYLYFMFQLSQYCQRIILIILESIITF